MKRIKRALLLITISSMTVFMHCGDDGFVSVCAGCDNPDFPWSAPGSNECYATIDDCEASERGECTICN